jgi:hypothetical protein
MAERPVPLVESGHFEKGATGRFGWGETKSLSSLAVVHHAIGESDVLVYASVSH